MKAVIVCLAVSAALGQQPAPEAVFRTTTKLVEVSVIAEEKQGNDKPAKPVIDLKPEDFQIFDNGAPQAIRLFVGPAAVGDPTEAQPPNTFTNQAGQSSTRHAGYSVILFDNLVTEFGDPFAKDGTGFGVQKVRQALQGIPQGEKIAIYALGRKLQVIGEFTTDRSLLEERLRKWKPSPDDAKTGTAFCIPAPAPTPGPPTAGQNEAVESCVRTDSLLRQAPMGEEMKAIAEHLTGIPGRKNLIWMANQFPITGEILRRFIDADVAVYTIDEAGIKGSGAPPRIAQLTGGLNYAGRNDLAVAVQEAVEDGRTSYLVGFYEANDDRPLGLHQIAVRVSRPGIGLRYRNSYRAEATAAPRRPSTRDLIEALNRPVDATAIGIKASATRTPDRVRVTESIDVSSLDLQLEDGLWKGRAEVVARFLAADGAWAGEAMAETMTLGLKPATYDSMLQSGVPYHKELAIPAKAVSLKLLIGSLKTGKIGTLTIPLSEVPADGTEAK
jgi:VWFA-related protein